VPDLLRRAATALDARHQLVEVIAPIEHSPHVEW
jgi:hypothetical protein